MAIKINFDSSNNIETPTFVLAHRNGDKIGLLSTVTDVNFKDGLNDATEFTFTLYKKFDNIVCSYWDDVKDLKLIWVREWDRWFSIEIDLDESNEVVKNITAKSLGESELSQTMLYDIEINTETDIARDEYESPTVIYNSDVSISLLNRLLEKAPHYSIAHVDNSLKDIQRTFDFNDKSIFDAFQEVAEEIHCLFIFDCNSNIDGKINRSISVYDLESNCLECGYRGEFIDNCPECNSNNITAGYGEDTAVFVSKDNLADGINYSVDVDSVKNCFKLEAGDDLMTAVVASCNPNGTDYIWYFSDDIKEDMSEELRNKIESYDASYKYYQSEHVSSIDSSSLSLYNGLVNKYTGYGLEKINNPIVGYPNLINAYFNTIDLVLFLESKMMPTIEIEDITAQSQVALLTSQNLSPISINGNMGNISLATADSYVLSIARIYVNSRYKVKIDSSFLQNSTIWGGKFTVTSYSDDDDVYTSGTVFIAMNNDYENFIKQKVEKLLSKNNSDQTDISGLFKKNLPEFQNELRKYCLNSLNSFLDACQSCIDLLIEQGVSDTSSILYDSIYSSYYNKLLAIQREVLVRECEVNIITGGVYNTTNNLSTYGIQNYIDDIKDSIQRTLDFEDYLGRELWLEFCSYRREDKYKNDNYVSDGLNNSELFENAMDFIKVAQNEIYKSGNLQHSISSKLKNLLVMKEFKSIVDFFKVGNWIRICVDDSEIYRLRIVEYEINYNEPDNLSVKFSDVLKVPSGTTDVQSILNQASNMATSYSTIMRQSNINTNISNKVSDWLQNGLDTTTTKIVNAAENQTITWDSHGLLCRQYDEISDSYDDKQLKIINKGLFLTDDNWKSSRAGIGNFVYYDPKEKVQKEGYGVIADTICSNLILSKEVGIYNEDGSIEIGADGIVITTGEDYSNNVFTIQKSVIDGSGNETFEKQLYFDDKGSAYFSGNIDADSLVVQNAISLSYLRYGARTEERIFSLADMDGMSGDGELIIKPPMPPSGDGYGWVSVNGNLNVSGNISASNTLKFLKIIMSTSSAIAVQSSITLSTSIPDGSTIVGVNIYCNGSAHSLIYAGFNGNTNIYIRNVGTSAYTPPENNWVRIAYV